MKGEDAQPLHSRQPLPPAGDDVGVPKTGHAHKVREFLPLFLPQANARPVAVLVDEDDAGGFKGGADGLNGAGH